MRTLLTSPRLVASLIGLIVSVTVTASESLTFFESRIRPVLVEHCYECHSSGAAAPDGNLRVDFRQGLLDGGDSGPAIVAGQPAKSLLLEALDYESLQMPPAGKLADDVIADFERWIAEGAVDPRQRPPSVEEANAAAWQAKLADRRQWWSLQPPTDGSPPEAIASDWPVDPVDRFIAANQSQAAIMPASPADAQTLLRRLSFVLTGLPPQPEQVAAFEAKFAVNSGAAVITLVDQLLASPHFGERFARHWMDVVRYTDTYGYEWDNPAKGSWEYRDYLIRAFNDDIGFDQLIREQIAGDLLADPRIDPTNGVNESLVGPMFYHMGEHRHGTSLDFNGIHQEMIDNKIDAFSKAFLGMTVACARCHDHKLDAISQADYYALAGVFMSPRWTPRDISTPTTDADAIAELKHLRNQIRHQVSKHWTAHIDSPMFQADSLRQWATQNRSQFAATAMADIAYPLSQLLEDTAWFESRNVVASATAQSTEMIVEPDGALLATGDVPETDTYTVQFVTGPGTANQLQLEALTHASLGGEGPEREGPGRTAHGNFVLSHIQVEVKPLEPTSPDAEPIAIQDLHVVPFASATADFSQVGYPVEAALDPSPRNGWGIGGASPLNVNRTARFGFVAPIELPHGGAWKVTLANQYGSQHILGRFRISVGGQPDATDDDAIRQASAARVAARWQQLATDWSAERQRRCQSNADRFQILNDFSTPAFLTAPGFLADWAIDGQGMTHGYVADAAPQIALQGDTVIQTILPRGYHSGALSTKLAGAIRLPPPESFPKKRVSLRLAGGDWAGRINVPQNAFQAEEVSFFDPQSGAAWHSVGPQGFKNGVTRVLTEFNTASLNPNFPPRTGLARSGGTKLPDADHGLEKRSWISITGIVAHEDAETPVDTLDAFASLYESAAPNSADQTWEHLRQWLAASVRRWSESAATDADVRVLNWLITERLLPNDTQSMDQVASLVKRYREVESTIGYPRSVMSMDERAVEPINYRLNIRGDVDNEGQAVPRGFLEVFAGQHQVDGATNSGRLALAEYLASGNQPQTARVYVNRVWQWVFGTGLVATPNDFGKLGDQPSHPELLDWLAIRFIDEGWSTKQLIRRLVLSQTFRQSGSVDPLAAERDPDNRLLHHYPTRRLEAEAIRDTLLAASGHLNRSLYGVPINPPRVAEDSAKRLFSGPWDGHGRRSVYTTMSIMEPPKFLVGFNLPDLKLPTGRRDQTNVPAQALILLNSPLVTQLATRWATALVQDASTEPGQRIDQMFLVSLGRRPSDRERQRWVDAATLFCSPGSNIMSDLQVWTQIAHALFNTKEFIYYR